MTLLNEVFLRYGVPRRLISDNGTQFVSAVMQQLCFVLDINQSLIPVYHPQANPVERKNRDLKPRLAMMVGNNHTLWIEKLPAIRFLY
ncbi:retrovirus-related Pol polyprotein from transposon 412 [Trichonephila clavipes]|nr:retrovirus-related Pol polyprotein from transposon 412 [Trichonephila clavipes]